MERAEAAPALEAFPEFEVRRERGLWSDAFRRLIRNRLAMVALIVLAAVFILAVLGNTTEVVQRYRPSAQDYDVINQGPSWDHFFGTDSLGRDSWARVLEGLLISLQVGLGVQAVVLVIGMLVGGTAALAGRMLDNIMMRITDLAYAFPDLLAIILLRSVFADRLPKSRLVHFLGQVSDTELKKLLKNAIAFVFPSLIEGFGLPGLEAMSVGCPVIAARASCLPEIYGAAAIYFDPYNPSELANKINTLLNDSNLRREYIKRGIEQTKKYSWRKMAVQTWKIYQKILP